MLSNTKVIDENPFYLRAKKKQNFSKQKQHYVIKQRVHGTEK